MMYGDLLGSFHYCSVICIKVHSSAFCMNICSDTQQQGLPWWFSGKDSSCKRQTPTTWQAVVQKKDSFNIGSFHLHNNYVIYSMMVFSEQTGAQHGKET